MLDRFGRRIRRELERMERRNRLPDRAVLLLTNPRSGSTWLFDALRCHPGLVVNAEADLWAYFGMHGRRYPRDLKGDPDNAVQIEVQPGNWETMPRFALASALTSPARTVEPYALEKCHPHFFDHDVPRFVGRLKDLDATGSARVIYQMREPRASIVSFLRYKERNPQWNARIAPEQVIPHMRRIFESLAACAAAYPGLIVDYEELERDMQGALKRIFAWLWPGKKPSSDPALLAEIVEATSRGKRGATPFLGPLVSSADDAQYAPLLAQFADDLAACKAAYSTLRDMAAGSASA
jgi:hypothetical protein